MKTAPGNITEKRKVAAIGTFDGVHTGHREVLGVLARYGAEHQLMPVAITFDRHPLSLIDPTRTPPELTPVWKKKKLLKEVGITPLVLEFDEKLRSTKAKDWLEYIHKNLGVDALVVGYDTTFGSDGVMLSIEDYKKIGEEVGVKVIAAEKVEGVSSSEIRRAVEKGDMERAHELLGRPYSITAEVLRGNNLGHTLGYPTANIMIPEGTAMPKPGVYAAIVKTLYDGRKYPAMVNIGNRPTVMRGDEIVMESHLLNFNGDLYGKDITVRFIKRIRDERKFDSIEALKARLAEDKSQIENLFIN